MTTTPTLDKYITHHHNIYKPLFHIISMEKKINQEAKTFNVGEQLTETQEVKCIEKSYCICKECKNKRKIFWNRMDTDKAFRRETNTAMTKNINMAIAKIKDLEEKEVLRRIDLNRALAKITELNKQGAK